MDTETPQSMARPTPLEIARAVANGYDVTFDNYRRMARALVETVKAPEMFRGNAAACEAESNSGRVHTEAARLRWLERAQVWREAAMRVEEILDGSLDASKGEKR